ncbi:unnamed protein product [Symbiodinium sp. CCMP2592]|nr:unnamed protein product [Symbiodinium sp. CCMP2592]
MATLRRTCNPDVRTRYNALSVALRDLPDLPALQICYLAIAAVAPEAGDLLLKRVTDPEELQRVAPSTPAERGWVFTQLALLRMSFRPNDADPAPPAALKAHQGLLLEAFAAVTRLLEALEVTVPLPWTRKPDVGTLCDALSLALRDLPDLPALQICNLAIAAVAPEAGELLLKRVTDPEELRRVVESTPADRGWVFTQLNLLSMSFRPNDADPAPPAALKGHQGLLLEAFAAVTRLLEALDVTVPQREIIELRLRLIRRLPDIQARRERSTLSCESRIPPVEFCFTFDDRSHHSRVEGRDRWHAIKPDIQARRERSTLSCESCIPPVEFCFTFDDRSHHSRVEGRDMWHAIKPDIQARREWSTLSCESCSPPVEFCFTFDDRSDHSRVRRYAWHLTGCCVGLEECPGLWRGAGVAMLVPACCPPHRRRRTLRMMRFRRPQYPRVDKLHPSILKSYREDSCWTDWEINEMLRPASDSEIIFRVRTGLQHVNNPELRRRLNLDAVEWEAFNDAFRVQRTLGLSKDSADHWYCCSWKATHTPEDEMVLANLLSNGTVRRLVSRGFLYVQNPSERERLELDEVEDLARQRAKRVLRKWGHLPWTRD